MIGVEDFWSDLSWPTQSKIRKTLDHQGHWHSFSRATFLAYIDRLSEPSFVLRKG